MTNKDLFQAFGELSPDLIASVAPEEESRPTVKAKPSGTKRLLACAASLALVFGILFTLGFGNVYAAICRMFGFLPGVGITVQEDAQACVPIQVKVTQGTDTARLLRASYEKGTLRATISLEGRPMGYEDVALLVNGEARPLDPEQLMLAKAQTSALLELGVAIEAPSKSDRYQLQIQGFQEPLEFALEPCQTYEDLCQIGPTATQNGISITATAHRTGEELVVWCYASRQADATTDAILGYGRPANGSNLLTRTLATESGILQDTSTGWNILNRCFFLLTPTDKTASLTIPYLSMRRPEEGRLSVKLPQEPGRSDADAWLQTSLGTVRVVEVERQSTQEPGKHRILLHLAYENVQDHCRIYSLDWSLEEQGPLTQIPNGETGLVDCLEILVDSDAQSLELSAGGILYYLMGAYELPLDILP